MKRAVLLFATILAVLVAGSALAQPSECPDQGCLKLCNDEQNYWQPFKAGGMVTCSTPDTCPGTYFKYRIRVKFKQNDPPCFYMCEPDRGFICTRGGNVVNRELVVEQFNCTSCKYEAPSDPEKKKMQGRVYPDCVESPCTRPSGPESEPIDPWTFFGMEPSATKGE